MFLGDFEHNIDEKNRLSIPVKFREALGGKCYVCPSPDGCLFVYTEEEFNRVLSEIGSNSASREDRIRQRNALFGATDVTLDKQGRITLTPILMKKAGLTKEVIIFGVFERIEIWDKKRWNNSMGQQDEAENGLQDEDKFPTNVHY